MDARLELMRGQKFNFSDNERTTAQQQAKRLKVHVGNEGLVREDGLITPITHRIPDRTRILAFYQLLELCRLGDQIYCFADIVFETLKTDLDAKGSILRK